MKTAVGEHCQPIEPKCNTFSDWQPMETVQQWSDVIIRIHKAIPSVPFCPIAFPADCPFLSSPYVVFLLRE